MKLHQQFTTTSLSAVSAKRPKLEQTWDQTVSLPLHRSNLQYLKQIRRSLENAKKYLLGLFLLATRYLCTSSIKITPQYFRNSDIFYIYFLLLTKLLQGTAILTLHYNYLSLTDLADSKSLRETV